MNCKFVLIDKESDAFQSQWILPLPVTVGRCPTADITINDASISRRHCQFSIDPQGALVVRDLGSMNGIYVDERRVSKAVVPPHAIVRVGAVSLRPIWTDDELDEVVADYEIYDVDADTTQPMKIIDLGQPPQTEQ